MDGQMENDKVKFANEDFEGKKPLWQVLRSKGLTHLPTALSVLGLVLVIAAIVGLSLNINRLKSEIEQMKSSRVEKLTSGSATSSAASTAVGSAYTRWGKKKCPSNAELIYAGFVAGASDRTRLSGGGANYLCMTENPEWNKYDMKNDSLAFSWLYAANYMSYKIGIFDDNVHGHDIPCSVCHITKTSQVMIPGKRTCPTSWNKEYEGYLMSSYVEDNKMTYICIDFDPDVIEGTNNITAGATLYFVSGYCSEIGGFAFCPPYVHAREITCVVCSK